MTKDNFPSFFEWTYKRWYFWVLVILYSWWSGYEALVNVHIGIFIGVVVFAILLLSLFFLFAYLLARHNCKKLKHI